VTSDVTFCGKCGQNVHEVCIEKWKQSQGKEGVGERSVKGMGTGTCPMCRADWKNEPLLKSLDIKEELDAESVQIYLDWLYSGHLQIPASIDRKTDAFNVAVLKCWAVANAMQDETFKSMVVKMWFEEAEAQFWKDSVEWAFVEGNGDEEIKGFVVEVFMCFMETGWFVKEGKSWPDAFVRALADRALEGWMEGGQGTEGFEGVKGRWIGKDEAEIPEVKGDEKDSTVARSEIREPEIFRYAGWRNDDYQAQGRPPIRRSARQVRHVGPSRECIYRGVYGKGFCNT
jgi:hypothetical protein